MIESIDVLINYKISNPMIETFLLLVSPESRSAYFKEFIEVAKEELAFVSKVKEIDISTFGDMIFFEVKTQSDQIAKLVYLSFVQGIFKKKEDHLIPLDIKAEYFLAREFVFGSKFKGKTNERLTQMMINLGLASSSANNPKVLDPMCGRGTTLFWALRYGLKCRGIEQDPRAIADFTQIAKKWNKVCPSQLKFKEGFVGKKNKQEIGKFVEVITEQTTAKMLIGDSKNCESLLQKEKFDLIVADLPYGIQHRASQKARNPFDDLKEALPQWLKLLKEEGSIILAYNSYQPKRKEMERLMIDCKLETLPLSVRHRMSESIIRDVIVAKKQS